jgi:hypothetical protein
MRNLPRSLSILGFLLILAAAVAAQPKPAAAQDTFPPEFVPSGKVMFKQ